MSTRKVHAKHPLAAQKGIRSGQPQGGNSPREMQMETPEDGPVQRIDAAHPLPPTLNQQGQPGEQIQAGDSDPKIGNDKVDAAVPKVGGLEVDASEIANLHWQAAQLGEQLQKRQDEISERRSELQSDLVRFEADQRKARAEMVDRERLLKAREEELDQRARALAEQIAAAAAAEAGADREHTRFAAVMAEREEKAARWEEKLKQQHESLISQQRALVESARRWQTQRDELANEQERKHIAQRQQLANLQSNLQKSLRLLERKSNQLEELQRCVAKQQHEAAASTQARVSEELSQRRQLLAVAEKLIAKRQAELDQLQAELQQQKSDWHAAQQQELARLERESVKREKIWADRVASLDAWEKTLTLRYEAAQQLRDDALELQREGLEMRLAAEQLWAHLVDVVPADERTQAISKIRKRLAESQKLVLEDISAHRQELVSLGERLEKRRVNLSQQKAELQTWLHDRRTELDEEAARLMNRNRVLDRREAELEELAQQIVEERMEYEDLLRSRAREAA